MGTPRVTEIRRRLEPVVHDTFIDDLAPAGARAAGAAGDGHRHTGRRRLTRHHTGPGGAAPTQVTLHTP
jgi:hypothetical protein